MNGITRTILCVSLFLLVFACGSALWAEREECPPECVDLTGYYIVTAEAGDDIVLIKRVECVCPTCEEVSDEQTLD